MVTCDEITQERLTLYVGSELAYGTFAAMKLDLALAEHVCCCKSCDQRLYEARDHAFRVLLTMRRPPFHVWIARGIGRWISANLLARRRHA